MSNSNLYTHQEANTFKTWVFLIFFFVLVIVIGWFISYYLDNPAILYFAAFFAILMNFFSYWYSDKIVLKLHRAKPVTRAEYFELWNMTENLAITAGLPMPRLYVVDDPAPNAFATGRDEKHAVIAVTTGLMQILDRNEMEGVIAHELSHIGNKDMLLSTIVVVMVGFISILSDIFLRSGIMGGRNRDSKAGGIIAIVGIALLILAPIAATLIRLAISRKREFLADASGALLTRYPEGLASALKKISTAGVSMRTAHDATAHLFISNPFAGKKASSIHKLFMTHPPLEDRVGALIGR